MMRLTIDELTEILDARDIEYTRADNDVPTLCIRINPGMGCIITQERLDRFSQYANDEAELIDIIMSPDHNIKTETLQKYVTQEFMLKHVIPVLYGPEYTAKAKKQNPEVYSVSFLGDVSVFFKVICDDTNDCTMSYLVTKPMLEGITEYDLFQHALKNNTPKICSLSAMLGLPDEVAPMLVGSNTEARFGAGVILNDRAMKTLYDDAGEFYILPSSIHEVIFVRKDGVVDSQSLLDMVTQINATEVSEADKLTDAVWYYDGTRINEI